MHRLSFFFEVCKHVLLFFACLKFNYDFLYKFILMFSYDNLLSLRLTFVFSYFFGIGLLEDESKHLMHLNLQRQLDDVRWNHANQDEVLFTYISINFYVVRCCIWSEDLLLFFFLFCTCHMQKVVASITFLFTLLGCMYICEK